MTFELPPLPYPYDALEPHVSRRTMELHHDKHHGTYVKKLNDLVQGSPFEGAPLENIVRKTARAPEYRALFNNAAQTWNHTFFWHCMQPKGGGAPSGRLATELREAFGGYDAFRKKFLNTATEKFGSGYAWLVRDGDTLDIVATADAYNPMVDGKIPLLTCDVWEHAYYLDYQNRRQAFVEAFLDHLVNWEHVADCLARAAKTEAAFEAG